LPKILAQNSGCETTLPPVPEHLVSIYRMNTPITRGRARSSGKQNVPAKSGDKA
jgi:hypothetical protein